MTNSLGTSRTLLAVTAVVIAFGTIPSDSRLAAQQSDGLSQQVVSQMNALMDEKASRTPAQRKMDSQLVYAAKMARGEQIASNLTTLRVDLADVNERGLVLDVRADVSDRLLDQMRALGAEVLDVSAVYRNIRIRVGMGQIEAVAALPDVSYVQPKQEFVTSRTGTVARQTTPAAPLNIRELRMQKRIERADVIRSVSRTVEGGNIVASVGSRSSEGDVTHRAAVARATYGVSGAGVRIGVLSDGVAGLASSQTSGNLGTVTILDGKCTVGVDTPTCAEGTAMLEIIHDLAPGAELYFATGIGGTAVFAQNIRKLQAAGCTIIVDDLTYSQESPFQDGQVGTSATNGGIVTQAVKDVTAAGVLYLSAATNSGNKNDNTSGTWEGNFVDGGSPTAPLPLSGRIHNFGGQAYNQLSIDSGQAVALFWSDPLGASANDYDLYILNSAGTSIVKSSTNYQTGTEDPYEEIVGSSAGQRVVIIKFSGSARFLHLDSGRNRFQISTAGAMHGHAATTAPNSLGVAATPAATAFQSTPAHVGPYPGTFSGSNTVESFSSDGPRRIFFTGNGSPLTPGNFSSTGGQVLQKPDFTAADGVSISAAGGFSSPFYGTSAAAPHAAAIAALVKSRNLAQTASQVRAALFSSAIDIEGFGVDRDSGVGIIMADTAVAAVNVGGVGPTYVDADGDGRSDLAIFRPSNGTWYTRYSAQGYSAATASAFQWGLSGDVPISGDFDGDGKLELTVFRPSNGTWYLRYSSQGYALGSAASVQWGLPGDLPISDDFDGDGKTDLTVFRPSNGTWYVRYSSQGYAVGTAAAFQWGLFGDLPISGDMDGDGKADLVVWRPSNGTWYVRFSSTGYAFASAAAFQFGLPQDLPISAADFDGDGKTDLVVWRPSNGTWYLRFSAQGVTTFAFQWGLPGDVPIAADFDGDGKTDLTVWRPSNGTWYVLYSSFGFHIENAGAFQWGLPGDAMVK